MSVGLYRFLRRAVLGASDVMVCICCSLFAVYTVTGSLAVFKENLIIIVAVVFVQLLFLGLFKIYAIRLLDSSLELFVRGSSALAVSGVLVLIGILVGTADFSFSFRIVTSYVGYSTLVLLGYRIVYRVLFSYHIKGANGNGLPRTVVYGAGEIGLQLARQHFKKKLPYNLVAFLDDDPMKHLWMVSGIPVQGTLDDLGAVIQEKDAKALIIAITDLSSKRMKFALDEAERFSLDVKIVPSLFEMAEGRKSVADLRSINYNDMLGRSPISIDREPIQQMVRGKRVLVTGAGGSIGSEICKQLISYQPDQLLLLDIDETELHDLSLRLHAYQKEFSYDIMPIVCDVKNVAKVEQVFEKFKPEIVFHAAAYKHVPMMEYYPEEAIRTNIAGTYTVLSTAVRHQVRRCIVISTDKAVNPTNVMGATKRVSELVASMLTTPETEIVCVRFGNVLGSRGSMLPLFLEQIREGLPITVTDKRIIRYFMTIPEAVSLVFLASAMGNGGEVMVLDMGEQVNIYEFAKRLVKYFGDGRSEVVITGLRPGEKLFEEKLSDKDHTVPTDNPKVFKAIVNGTLDRSSFNELMKNIHSMDSCDLVGYLRSIVPEFIYQGPCEVSKEA
jgi:FlaA1/EpsC-like NDP-sugar epimerase